MIELPRRVNSREFCQRTGCTVKDMENHLRWGHLRSNPLPNGRLSFGPEQLFRGRVMNKLRGIAAPSAATKMGKAIFDYAERDRLPPNGVIMVWPDYEGGYVAGPAAPQDEVAFGFSVAAFSDLAEEFGRGLTLPAVV